ncbi:lactate/malate family dehydrogenase [Staphylococcus canis]|uniref:Lactate dehydrogenase n=1 Tax=Staphylococcus canis TaxID=2724942 RepID=A0ABS0T6F3_9STAP|nr:lactate dehydrogenase [Staphylococcus canis]MBI5974326.1 lactate dehydrogenase [Staphylococcus canis]
MANRIALIGVGRVGSQILTDIQYTGLFQEIYLIDSDEKQAEGEVLDHLHFQSLNGSHQTRIYNGTYEDLKKVDAIVISASVPSDASMKDRAKLASLNADLVNDIMNKITAVTTEPIIIMISNPIDSMLYLAQTQTNYPLHKIFGTGTMLESSRFRVLIASHYNVDPKNVEAFVIGEHGKTTVPVWSRVRIFGMPLGEFEALTDATPISKQEIRDSIDEVAFNVMANKGWTNSAISRVAVDLLEAIMYNENRILPVTSVHQSIYDYQNVAFSLPTFVNRDGYHHPLEIQLDSDEKAALDKSVQYIKETIESTQK